MEEPPLPSFGSLDPALCAIGFQYDAVSPHKVTGHLTVTKTCCQPFGLLHGGVSAMLAEALASLGTYVASGLGRIAGAQLSINHLRSAALGDTIVAEATPAHTGKAMQVWEVKLWKVGTSDPNSSRTLISTSTVAVMCSRAPQGDGNDYETVIRKVTKKFAKL